MQKSRLGWTDLDITKVGLGTWAMGGGNWKYSWGPQNDEESISVIRRALELGINWIDTAPIYGLGHAEEVVGRAIKELDASVIIATKCGPVWGKDGEISSCLKKESVRSEIESSLRRLKIEAIDLYQIHWPDPDKDIEEAWAAIAGMIKEGKIRYAGVSNFNMAQLKRIQSIHPVASLQPPYSMLNRSVEEELLVYCSLNNIGVIAYSPLQTGILTGKFTQEYVQNLPEDDHRRQNPSSQEPELSANLRLVEGLRSIAEKRGMTATQLAIAWVIRRPEVTSAIVGARRPSHIEETVGGGEWGLSGEEIAAIEKFLDERQRTLKQN